jgi:hypothetical protein
MLVDKDSNENRMYEALENLLGRLSERVVEESFCEVYRKYYDGIFNNCRGCPFSHGGFYELCVVADARMALDRYLSEESSAEVGL